MAAIPGPIDILREGPLKALDDVEPFGSKESADLIGKANRLEERGTSGNRNRVNHREGSVRVPLFPFPAVREEMDLMPHAEKTFHEDRQVTFRPTVGGVLTSD